MESSRRELLNDVAEHRPILKNNQNTYHTRFGFTPETGTASPKRRFYFYFDESNFQNDRNTYYPRFIFLSETGQSFLKQMFHFICKPYLM